MNVRITDRFTGLFSAPTVSTVSKDNGVYDAHILRYSASRCAKNEQNQTTIQSDTSFLRFIINTQNLTAGMVRFVRMKPW